MKLKVNYILPLVIVLFTACNNHQKMENATQSIAAIFPKGEKVSNENFTGTVWLHYLAESDTVYNVNMGSVSFEPGARTNWHAHKGGQILLVTAGKGLYQERGKPVEIIEKGDALNYNEVKNAIAGQDMVYVNLAGDLDAMSKNIIKAMKETDVKRVIAISSIGIFETPLKPVLKPYRALSDNFESSGLDYTILRPDWFTHGSEIDYHITHKGEPETGGALSRKSIAAFVASLVQNPEQYSKENLGISRL